MSTSEAVLLSALRAATLLMLALSLFCLSRQAMAVAPSPAPAYGLRGKRRGAARRSSLFCALEPLTAQLAGWLGALRVPTLRGSLTRALRHASEPCGWSADELLALSLLCFACLGSGGYWLMREADLSIPMSLACWLLAAWLPFGRVTASAKQRAKQLERSLPVAMDLCVLCMGAGLDFPGALAFVVAELGSPHEVCRDELSQLLDELALGRTRVEALEALATRSSSVAVQEFVSAICQSEEKGTPMIEALVIQSTTLRQRRSVRAEELAAQAGVKMMLPLMLLVASLLMVVFGPIIVSGVGL